MSIEEWEAISDALKHYVECWSEMPERAPGLEEQVGLAESLASEISENVEIYKELEPTYVNPKGVPDFHMTEGARKELLAKIHEK